MINTTINTSLFLNNSLAYNVGGYIKDYPAECYKSGVYSLECLHASICPQFNEYFISVGMKIIIAYIIVSWLSWWYFKHGYKLFPLPNNSFFGDVTQYETRVYWTLFIYERAIVVMIMFIVIVVWLSINTKI